MWIRRFAARRRLFPDLHRDLGLQVLAIYLLFVGPVLLGALFFDLATRANLEQEVQSADLALAQAIAYETNASLANAAHTVQNLALLPGVRQGDAEVMRGVFPNIALARNDINLVYRLSASGIMLYHYPEGLSSTVGVDFSFREYFQAARESDRPIFSNGRISPTTGKPVATVVMPMRTEQGFLGVVATNLALEKLSDTLSILGGDADQQGLIVSIVDARGQVIAHPGLPDARIPEQAMLTITQNEDLGLPEYLLPDWGAWNDGVVQQVLDGTTGTLISTAPDDSRWVRSFVPIPTAGWGVIVQRPAQTAFASIERFHRWLLIAIGIFIAGGIVFWLALTRRVIAPLEQLAEFSQNIGANSDILPGESTELKSLAQRGDQVGHLARSLTTMAGNIHQRFRELSTLLETSRTVVSSLDSADVINSILDEVQRLLDVERCAVVILDERGGVFRIRASRGLSQSYVKQLRIEPSEPASVTMRALNQQTPVQVSDTETDVTYADYLRKRARSEGYRSLLAVPLLTQHAPPAALLLYRPQQYTYSATELELVSSFANHAAMAMEHAALYAQSDEQLQEQTRRLEAIVESLNDGLILAGTDDHVLFCNQRAASSLGLTRMEARGKKSSELTELLLLACHDAEKKLASWGAMQQAGAVRSLDVTHSNTDGRLQDIRIHLFTVTDSRGELIGRGQYWQDITHDKEVDRMKSALLSTVSHELRTPLASIKGFASTLLAEDVQWDRATQREFIQTISDESDRLAQLVSDLLDLSRVEGGYLQIHRELQPIGEIMGALAEREGLRLGRNLAIVIEPELPPVWVDRARIETVIRNLVDNAAKYGPPDTVVEMRAERRNGNIVIQVRDFGTGIPRTQRERIFHRFVRGEIDAGLHSGGAGLGLAICRGFVEAHGGRIWVEDANPGANFMFTLPLHVPELDEAIDQRAMP